jgi:glycosyltransferase involved in cell wall biosynthesis
MYWQRPRPDVAELLPGWSANDAGFFGVLYLDRDREGAATLLVTVVDAEGGRVSLERSVFLRRPCGALGISDEPADAALYRWLTAPLTSSEPVVTAGLIQCALTLSRKAQEALFGPDRLDLLQRILVLRELNGEDLLPTAVLEASWLKPGDRLFNGLPIDWRTTAWGRQFLLWLEDPVIPGQIDEGAQTRFHALLDSGVLPLATFESDPVLADPTSFGALRSRQRRIAGPIGLNLYGHYLASSGLGEATRATLRSVRASGCAHQIIDLGPTDRSVEPPREYGATRTRVMAINVVHDNASTAGETLRQLGARRLLSHYDIGYWYWELAHLPKPLTVNLAYLDEVWAPSQFVIDALRTQTSAPITLVPPSVDVSGRSGRGRTSFGLPERQLLFLTMASAFSATERKNPVAVLDAFTSAFPDARRDGVGLVIKINGARFAPQVVSTFEDVARTAPVFVITESLSRADLLALIDCCDVLVSLHRSEGFGLPIAEAMALGKPAIATAYSGNEDFTSSATAFPVSYELITLAETNGPYERGFIWADPDREDAAAQMRNVVNDPANASRVARAGQKLINERFSASAIGPTIRRRVDEIAVLLGVA